MNSQTLKSGRFKVPVKSQPDSVAPSRENGPTPQQIADFAGGAGTRNTAPPPATFFSLRTEDAQAVKVVVKGQIRRGDVAKSSYLQIPGPTYQRLEKVLMGALTPGIIGLIEFALDELERQGKMLSIDNHK